MPALRGLLEVATPERLIGIAMPIFVALRDRLDTLIDAVAAPAQHAIAELIRLIDEIDLGPVRQSVDSVFQGIRHEIESLQPAQLLAEPLGAFDAVKAEVAAFDPLKAVLAIVDGLRAAINRILGKLKAEVILATPLEIYGHIMLELGKLDIRGLLTPVLDQLDAIAAQVDGGLTVTVEAFKRLQESLPSGEGSALELVASVSVDVDVDLGF